MADLEKTISIIFGGKDNLSPTTKTLTKELGSFDSAVQNVAGPVSDFTKDLLATEAAILALGLAMAGVALNEAGKFAGSIEEIGTLFNGTADEVKQLESTLLEYARNSSSAIEEVNQAAYIAISTGAEWAKVTETLAAAEKLATVGATDLATATGALQRVMNSYGLSAEEATSVSEALFTAVQNGDTTMEALASNIGKVASIASGAGADFEELLSAVAALTIAGISTKESMTGLKSLFKDLSDPSKELTKALGGMTLETNTLQELMQVLQEKTGGSLEEFNKLFPSIRSSQSAMILANDAAGAFNSTLQAMEDRSGKLSASYEKMSLAFTNVNQTLVNNLRATLIQTGLPLLDEYGTAIKALTAIFDGIGDGIKSPNFDAVYSSIEKFVNNFSSKVDEIANILPEAMADIDFTGLIRSFSDVSDTVGDTLDSIFGSGLDLSKPEDLAKALQGAVNILTTFVNLTDGILTGLQPIFDVLGKAAQEAGNVSSEVAKATGELLGAITLIGEFGTAMGGALIVMKEVGVNVTNVFSVFEGAAKLIVNTFQVVFDAFVSSAAGIAANIAAIMSNITFGDVAANFERQAIELNDLSKAAAANLIRNTGDMVDGWNKLGDGLTGDATKEASKSLEDLGDEVKETNKPINDLGDTVDNFNTVIDESPSVIAKVTAAMGEMSASTELAGKVTKITSGEFKGWYRVIEDGVEVFYKSKAAAEGAIKPLDKITETEKKLAEESKKAAEAAEKLQLEYAKLEVELEKIASNERIKTMEFAVEFEIAKVEADAKKVVAAFESVADSYAATSELIGKLYEGYGDLNISEKFDVQDSIEKAEALAREQWETQKKLIDTQIEQIEAATARSKSGDALITVDGGDLQPELEAIMQSLFKSIRIRMSADYESFLLGLTP